MSRPVVRAVSLLALAFLYLSESLAQTPDGTFTLYGPQRFERSGGGSTTITDVLSLPEGIGSPYTLYVTNGETKDRRRVSGAEIRLNGTVVVQSSELTSSVGSLKRTVQLIGRDRLQVRLTGSSHSFITIRVTGTDTTPPRLTISSPADQLITSRSKIVVSGHAEDATAVRVTVNGTNVSVKYKGTFRTYLQLSQGQNTITIVAKDAGGNTTTATRIVYRDNAPPALTVSEPASGFVTKSSPVGVKGTAVDRPNGSPSSKVTVKVDGKTTPVDGSGAFSGTVTLREGKNKIYIVATDAAGNDSRVKRYVIRDTTPPKLVVRTPADKMTTCDSSLTVSGKVTDKTVVSLTLSLNGGPAVSIPVRCMGLFKQRVLLAQGTNTLKLTATDAAGNSTVVTRTVTRRITSLILVVKTPVDETITTASSITVAGTVKGVAGVSLRVNGTPVSIATDGSFSTSVLLVEGSNVVTVTATDGANNTYTIQRLVIRDTTPPVIAITEPVEGFVTKEATVVVSGTVEDSTSVTVTVKGVPALVAENGDFTSTVTLDEGVNTITITATDMLGITSTATRDVRRDTTSPSLTILQPLQGFVTAADSILVTGLVADPPVQATLTVTLDDMPVTVNQDGSFSGYVLLPDQGTDTLTVVATDTMGNSTTVTRIVRRDSTPPTLSLTQPGNGIYTAADSIVVSGTASDPQPGGAPPGRATVTINGVSVSVGSDGSFSGYAALPTQGIDTITVIASDSVGNKRTETRTVFRDSYPPAVTVSQPSAGLITKDTALTVAVTVTDSSSITVRANSVTLVRDSAGVFTGQVPLVEGTNTIAIVATDTVSNSTTVTRIVRRDSTPPTLSLTQPGNGIYTAADSIVVSGTASDPQPGGAPPGQATVTINGIPMSVGSDGSFSGYAVLSTQGTNTITVIASDSIGNKRTETRTVIRDSYAPVITLSEPTSGLITKDTVLTVAVTVTDSSSITVRANSVTLVRDSAGAFTGQVPLVEGTNTITIVATDTVGNTSTVTRTLRRDTSPPVIAISQPTPGLITKDTVFTVIVTVADSTGTTVTANGTTLVREPLGYSAAIPLLEGANKITVVATDTVGNNSTAVRLVIRDTRPPVVIVSQPGIGTTTKDTVATVAVTIVDSTATSVRANNISLVRDAGGVYRGEVSLVEGPNTITIVATDTVSNSTTVTRIVRRDSTPPTLSLTQPGNGIYTAADSIVVSGTASDPQPGGAPPGRATVTINGVSVSVGADGSFSGLAALPTQGTDTITVIATDSVGNKRTEARTVIRDSYAPVITVSQPTPSLITKDTVIAVAVSVTDSSSITVRANSVRLVRNSAGVFTGQVPLVEGTNTITIVATDTVGNTSTVTRTLRRDTSPPVIAISQPTPGLITKDTVFTVIVTVTDSTGTTVTANGTTLVRELLDKYSAAIPLLEGSNKITVVATDTVGNNSTAVRLVIRDTRPPVATVSQPGIGTITKDTVATVAVTIVDSTATSVRANNISLVRDAGGVYRGEVSLVEGLNTITIVATDAVSNSTTVTLIVRRDSTPPTLSLAQPANGIYTAADSIVVSGTASDPQPGGAPPGQATVTINGISVSVGSDGSFSGYAVLSTQGTNTITIIATDSVGNKRTEARTVIRDSYAPVITVSQPTPSLITKDTVIAVAVSVTDSSSITVRANSVRLVRNSAGVFTGQVPLVEGTNTITIVATDTVGNTSTVTKTLRLDTSPPMIVISQPTPGLITKDTVFTVIVTVTDSTGTTVTANGTTLVRELLDKYSAAIPLLEGSNKITVVATDTVGNNSTAVRLVIRDTRPPVATVSQPGIGTITKDTVATLAVTIVDSTATSVRANNISLVRDAGGVYRGEVPLVEGLNTITIVATDAAGNSITLNRSVFRDATPPVLTLSSPTNGTITNQSSVTVSGTVTDATAVTVAANGVSLPLAGGAFSGSIPLVEGPNAITVVATDTVGNSTTVTRSLIRDSSPPIITVTQPSVGVITKDLVITVSVTVTDSTATSVTANGTPLVLISARTYGGEVSLVEGPNIITVTATDTVGNSTSATRLVIRDTAPPIVTVVQPSDGLITKEAATNVIVSVVDSTSTTVTANSFVMLRDISGTYNRQLFLVEGLNVITIVATDTVGNSTTVSRTVRRDAVPPTLTVLSPTNGQVTAESTVIVQGTVFDSTTVTLTLNGNTLVVGSDGSFSRQASLVAGENTLIVSAVDAAGNVSTISLTVTRQTVITPPDPSLIAPPLSSTLIAVRMSDAVRFLYANQPPIQTGIDTTRLTKDCLGIVKGRVTTLNGDALPGVQITVDEHPEFGQTISRTDGMFDLIVNGASRYSLTYKKNGYLPAARWVDPACNMFAFADTVALVVPDTAATTITFTQPVEIAKSSFVQDADGIRRVVLAFQQGTQAQMVLPNGSIVVLPQIKVRATEYSVGPKGPNAMPALLPPTSGYTYCANLTADEALAAGAKEVRFSKPVMFYVDNFIGFPVGMPVPVGYYDFPNRVWVPKDDGRVIQIVSIVNGLAKLAVDNAGVISDSARLAAFGITQGEQQYLATLYQPGQSIMRTAVSYFGMYDKNCGVIAPDGAKSPLSAEPDAQVFEPTYPPMQPSGSVRAVTGVLNQKMERDVAVTGAPFSLHYSSERQLGRKGELFVDVSGDTLPPGVKRILVEVSVAGQLTKATLPAQTKQTYHFVWDGKDGYGRTITGEQDAKVKIGYVYDGAYQLPTYVKNNFALMSGTRIPLIRAREEVTLWQNLPNQTIECIDGRTLGAGGWTVSNKNEFNPQTGTVYYGNGQKKNLTKIGSGVNKVSTNDPSGLLNPGFFDGLWGLDVTPNGMLYVLRKNNGNPPIPFIIRVVPGGLTDLVMGNGISTADSIPASQALLDYTSALDVDGQGNVFLSMGYLSNANHRIRKIDQNGIITTVAGVGAPGFTGDGGPARLAKLSSPGDVAVSTNGDVYITDTDNRRIRRVGLDGIITTVAGGGTQGILTDGMVATTYSAGSLSSTTVGVDGTVYFLENNTRIIRLGTDGRLYHFAGKARSGSYKPIPDGTPAKQAELGNGLSLRIGPGGLLYVASPDRNRIFVIDGNGTVRTVLGTGNAGILASNLGKPPLATDGPLPFDVTFGPYGTPYFLERYGLYEVSPVSIRFVNGVYEIASNNGSEIYVFDNLGRHIRTRNALTGLMISNFFYDAGGRPSQVMDRDSIVSQIERDANGNITAIVSPKGERTQLALDAKGMLSGVTNPNGETISFRYSEGGLLSSVIAPLGGEQTMAYDSTGHLISAATAETPAVQLAKTQTANGYSVTSISPTGIRATTQMDQFANGSQRLAGIDPLGRTSTASLNASGVDSVKTPDGTTTIEERSYDPRFGLQVPIAGKTTVRTPSGLTSVQTQTRTVTLMAGNEVKGMTDKTNINGREWASAWDGNARTQTQTSPEGRKSIKYLNTKDQLVKDSILGLAATYYEYDTEGRVITMRQAGRISRYSYDNKGRLLSTTDPIGRKDSLFYDEAGRVTRQVYADRRIVGYSYDINGNMTSLTPPGKPAHTFAYDMDNRPVNYLPPLLDGDTTATRYVYDSEGRLQRTVFADSSSINVAYDPVDGKTKAVTFDRGTIGFAYDQTSGNLKQMVGVRGDTLVYAYDGSLLLTEEWRGEVKGRVAVRYDNSFRVIHENINGADSIALQYDRDDLPVRVGALGLRRNTQNGIVLNDTLQSLISDYSYNSAGELTGVTVKRSGVAFYSVSYTRDSLGRITTRKDSIQGVTQRFSYGYDLAGRLREVKRNDTTQAIYAYDANGNRVARTTPAGVDSGAYDAQDRLLKYGHNRYGYSPSGYLKYKVSGADSTSFSYDACGNLVSVRLADGTWVQYLIDAANRRVGKKVNGVTMQRLLYSGDLRPVAEVDSAGGVVTRYVFATRENVPEYMVRGGVVYRFVLDHLGSVRLVVNSQTGGIVQRLDYDEFGNVLFDSNPGFQPFGFAGGLYDQQTKLVRFGARDYDAMLGRWLAKDPYLFSGGDLNVYSYVRNNPVNLRDPKGRFLEFAFAALHTAVEAHEIKGIYESLVGAIYALANYNVQGALAKAAEATEKLLKGAMFENAASLTVPRIDVFEDALLAMGRSNIMENVLSKYFLDAAKYYMYPWGR